MSNNLPLVMTLAEIEAVRKSKPITIKRCAHYDEYRVPGPYKGRKGKFSDEAGAYYTNDKQDAINTGHAIHGASATFVFRSVQEW